MIKGKMGHRACQGHQGVMQRGPFHLCSACKQTVLPVLNKPPSSHDTSSETQEIIFGTFIKF